MNFLEKLSEASRRNRSLVCVGLDPDPALMPAGVGLAEFNRAIVEATSEAACAYKLNLAFYEALGDEGTAALRATIEHVPDFIPVIGDGKRNDIGNTAKAYARAFFDGFRFDAATVNPYMGYDSLEPFIQYRDKGVFVLCRTSNKGAVDFQDLKCEFDREKLPLYEVVARKVSQWNTHGNLGLVVGATYPDELKKIREEHPGMPLLIPGVGAQGGELPLVVRYGVDSKGRNAVINSSRQIIYASKRPDFAQAARRAATELRDQINRHLPG
ncbi:MAG: orotidine-5'-phosphate decarboxylase [Chloroflexi bacterium]|nr:orotidine-5'-phosphate decarboxylase [Chloroflexota bacterium]